MFWIIRKGIEMSKVVAVVLAALLWGCASAGADVKSGEGIRAAWDLRDNVAMLSFNDRICGGVYLSAEYILTMKHCVEVNGDAAVNVGFFTFRELKGKRRFARVVKRFKDLDLAVIKTLKPLTGIRYVKLACRPERFGEMTYVVGHPYGRTYTLASALVGSADLKYKSTLLTMPVRPGHSGGGVFTPEGELLGLISEAYVQPQTPWTVDFYNIGAAEEVWKVCDKLTQYLAARPAKPQVDETE